MLFSLVPCPGSATPSALLSSLWRKQVRSHGLLCSCPYPHPLGPAPHAWLQTLSPPAHSYQTFRLKWGGQELSPWGLGEGSSLNHRNLQRFAGTQGGSLIYCLNTKARSRRAKGEVGFAKRAQHCTGSRMPLLPWEDGKARL